MEKAITALTSLFTAMAEMRRENERLKREVAGEREARDKLDRALRQDEAMGVLFKRMNDASVDYSDLIP